jgi:hypothetical protein
MPSRKNNGLMAFLESEGKLGASGDELAQIKKQWRRQYEKSYKQQRRLEKKEYTVSFDKVEVGKIRKAAADHRIKEAPFLKKAVGGYLNTEYIVRDKAVLDRVLQILLRYQSVIDQVQSRDNGAWYKPDKSYENLNHAVNEMRSQIVDEFSHPPRLTEEVKRAIKENPDFVKTLKSILAEYDFEVNVPRVG